MTDPVQDAQRLQQIEDGVMAHRYLYYVRAEPVLTDFSYDALERLARAELPPGSPVHGVGSSLPASYTPAQVALAERLLGDAP